MEAIVRAVFEDGRKFGGRESYNTGYADGSKGNRPEPPKLSPGTLSIPATGVLPAGYDNDVVFFSNKKKMLFLFYL